MAKISHNQMAKLFYRLATAYDAGIDIRTIFSKESEKGPTGYRINHKKVLRQINEGETLATAMTRTEGFYPELAISVVQAGEAGGRLEEAFSRLAHHYKSLVDFRNRFLNSIAWPCLELAAAIGVVALLIVALGWVAEIMQTEPLDIFGLGLGTMGNLVLFLSGVTLFFGLFGILVIGTLRGWFGTLPMRIATRIPLIGATIEALSLSRFAWTVSIAEQAGMKPIEVSRLALRSTENFYYTNLQDKVSDLLQRGATYYETLDATETFPEEFLTYVDTGEMSGELAETMDRISHQLRDKAERNLDLIGKVGFFLVFLFVAVLIGATVVMLYSRYLNMLSTIAN